MLFNNIKDLIKITSKLLTEKAIDQIVELIQKDSKNILSMRMNVREYVLSKRMKDSEIKNNLNFVPIDKEEFKMIKNFFIINPLLGEKIFGFKFKKESIYIMHIKMNDGELCTRKIEKNKWEGSYVYSNGQGWEENTIFIYLDYNLI
jgi:hypothetical protein